MEEKEESEKVTFDDTGMLDGTYYKRLVLEAIKYVKNKEKKKENNKTVDCFRVL